MTLAMSIFLIFNWPHLGSQLRIATMCASFKMSHYSSLVTNTALYSILAKILRIQTTSKAKE